MNTKWVIAVLASMLVWGPGAYAGELMEDLDMSGTMDFNSAYIWRAQTLVDSPVLQPSANVTYKGFAFDFWGNWDLTDEKEFTEIDYTWSYGTDLGFLTPDKEDILDKVSIKGGYTFYTFPNLDEDDISNEVFAGVSLDTFLKPYYAAYWDFDAGDGWYHEWGIGHTFDLDPVTVDTGLSMGLNAGQWGYDTSLTALNFAMAVNIPMDKLLKTKYLSYVTVKPHINYSLPLDDQYDHELYGGVLATVAF